MEKEPITSQGLQKIKKELEELKNIQRPKIIEAIAEARGHGDLKENAEYHAAREKQGFIESNIQDLTDTFNRERRRTKNERSDIKQTITAMQSEIKALNDKVFGIPEEEKEKKKKN